MSNAKGAEVWIVRHGETDWSLSGQHTGRTDIALTAHGEQQAQAAGTYLAGRTFAQVYASPLQRARITARLAGFPEAQIEEDLAEWSYGELEGKTSAEFVATHPGWNLWHDGPPGGESVDQVLTRAHRFLEKIRKVSAPVLVFSHGHFLRFLAAAWVEADPSLCRRLGLDTGSIGVLGYERITRVIKSWNYVPHGA
jgi:probable phosphoglycerate mutase